RNACIIAHVDHGKTCLADCLLSSNGVISSRLAGKLRYLDNREDEQTRGITMKMSAISLVYGTSILNLVDSPGHVDFFGEVSSAFLLSDVAMLLIDVVEGVCSQTEFLIRRAIELNLDIVLVFNKLDRLMVELKLSPSEAFAHLRRLLEHVNSCISSFISGNLMEEADWSNVDSTEQNLYFSPEKDNVIFASAFHGYGFTLSDFAKMWSSKVNISAEEIQNKLFTDSYIGKNGIRGDAERLGKKTLFEQFILQPLWDMHRYGIVEPNLEKLKMFATKMNINIRSRRPGEAFDEFMRNWLPLAHTCLRSVFRSCSPDQSFRKPERLTSIQLTDEHPLYEAVRNCDENSSTVLLFVAKVIKLGDSLLAVCRIFSGTLCAGADLYVVGERGKCESELHQIKIGNIYMLVGREKLEVPHAKAGAICALELSETINSCTLCSEPLSKGFAQLGGGAEPLVRVSVQSLGDADDWHQLRAALKQISVLDSSVRIIEQENGEIALLTAGEVHLQKCMKDLADMGQTNLKVSEPVVSFMETIIESSASPATLSRHETTCSVRNGAATIKMRAVPLPVELVKLLEANEEALKCLRQGICDNVLVQTLYKNLLSEGVRWLKEAKGTWWSKLLMQRIWAFGPPRARFNILVNGIEDYDRPLIWEKASGKLRLYDQSVVAGFDLITGAGPLCEECMWGIGIVVEEWSIEDVDDPTFAGSLITAVKQTCRVALEKHPLRLVMAMYRCIIQTSASALGKVHTVLSQRRGKVIINEDMNQATGLFVVDAYMPIIESFSFCEQLRKRTSGQASGQLEFSHWEVLDEDPLWEPTTEDEVELYGCKADSVNKAKLYMDAMRKRKGLLTDEVIVVNAEKQRNLKRNK
uniref:Elongation factor-like 1 n=1 Tax=Syphacia muris TaxID=451379 RepID=A0A0N5AZU9_9BILA